MFEFVIFIIVMVVVIYLIWTKKNKGSIKASEEVDAKHTDIAIPDPHHTNDYRFFEFIEKAPLNIITSLVMKIQKKDLLVKDEFRKAMEEKLDCGEFKNPYSFKGFFGTKFDQIGIHFTKALDEEESIFQMTVYFIKDNALAYTESLNFSPSEEIAKNEEFASIIKSNNFDFDDILSRSFKNIWEDKSYKEFLNQNTIVFWDDDAKSLESVLSINAITDYKIKYIKLVDIIRSYDMPTNLEVFLTQTQTNLTPDHDLALINTSFLNDFKKSGVDLEKFIQTLESKA